MPGPVVGKVLAKVFVGVNFFDLLVLHEKKWMCTFVDFS